ncbi:MAG: ABC transporter substrate-binding protein [Actinomycetota bacterium]
MTRPRARLAMLLMIVAAACTGAGTDDPTPDGGASSNGLNGTISFMVFGDPEELVAYRQLIDAFEVAEPGITVELVETSDRDDLIARLSTAFSGGAPPDLFLMNYRFYGQFYAKDVLVPLQPYLDASDVFRADEFYPQAMEAFQEDGQQICMPQNISSLVVYYNKDLFDEAGVSYPEEGWTWGDFLTKAQALTMDADGDGVTEQYGVGMDPEIIRLAPFIWSSGGELVDDETNPTQFTLFTAETITTMQNFFDLHAVHGVAPGEEELESEDTETRFLNGTLGMVFSSRRDTPSFRTITDFDWDVAALPRRGQPAGILHSDAYCLTTASENKDEAWRFVEFALGPEGAPIVAASGRTVPSLIEVANSDAFLDPALKPANSEVFLDTIPVIRRVPTISTWPEIEDAANALLEIGFFEGAPAEEIAEQIVLTTKPIFARAE